MPHYRLAVLADIHGNLNAFEAVLTDLEQRGPLDGILAAGDIVTGPGQQEVVNRLVEMNAMMIKGNNEQAVARLADGTAPDYLYTAKQYALRRWAHDHLDETTRRLICDLPEQRVITLPGAQPIRMMHGSPRSINELVIPPSQEPFAHRFMFSNGHGHPIPLDEIFGMAPEPVMVFGHTHLPWCERLDGRMAMNPGAVCFPENGYLGAQYALLNWDGSRWTPEHYAIPYDIEGFRRSNEESGFLDASFLAKIFLAEALSGEDICPRFFKFANALAEQAGCADLPYIPDEIWDEAARLFVI